MSTKYEELHKAISIKLSNILKEFQEISTMGPVTENPHKRAQKKIVLDELEKVILDPTRFSNLMDYEIEIKRHGMMAAFERPLSRAVSLTLLARASKAWFEEKEELKWWYIGEKEYQLARARKLLGEDYPKLLALIELREGPNGNGEGQ